MSKQSSFIHFAAACFILAGSSSTRGQILLQDNFNSEHGSVWAFNHSSFANWTVTRGSVDLIGAGSPYDFYLGHGLFLDLDGSTSSAGKLESTTMFSLTPGSYRLEFDLGNTPTSSTNTVHVSLGTVFLEDFILTGTVTLDHITRDFVVFAPTSARLIFDHDGTDSDGLILDNVVFQAVPEPSPTALIVGSLCVGIGLKRLRSRHRAIE